VLLIRSFADKDTKAIYHLIRVPRFAAIERAALRRLLLLHGAQSLNDLAGAGTGLESLKHERKGQHSIRINRQYRLCFVWRDGDAFDVEITNYH
jgi:proteic killer suppression protein